jgi:hypothetical protein
MELTLYAPVSALCATTFPALNRARFTPDKEAIAYESRISRSGKGV